MRENPATKFPYMNAMFRSQWVIVDKKPRRLSKSVVAPRNTLMVDTR